MDFEKAKEALADLTGSAEDLLTDTGKLEALLQQLEQKLLAVPSAGTALSKVPLMISMIRSYITKEYTDVSPKVIATMVAAFIYLIKGKDLIPDKIPVVGVTDDVGVLALAFQFCKPELEAYKEFRDGKRKETE